MKNLKVNKKLLSMLLALSIGATPVLGQAEEKNDAQSKSAFKLVTKKDKAEDEVRYMTFEDYVSGVEKAYNEVIKHVTYGDSKKAYETLMEHVQMLYYFHNQTLLSDEAKETFKEYELNYESDFINNFMNALELINVISDYNESVIRHTGNIEDTIDMSAFAFDEVDKEVIHEIYVDWFNSHKNNTYDMDTFTELFKKLTTLNSEEQNVNAHQTSVGAKWFAQLALGKDAMRVLKDYFSDHYTIKELSKYFVQSELTKAQFVLRDDIDFDMNCKNELEHWVFVFGQLQVFCVEVVNNDLFRYNQDSCMVNTK